MSPDEGGQASGTGKKCGTPKRPDQTGRCDSALFFQLRPAEMTAVRSDKPSHGVPPFPVIREPNFSSQEATTSHVTSFSWRNRWSAFIRREGVDPTCETWLQERRLLAADLLSKVGGGKCAQDWTRIATWDNWLPQPDTTGAVVRELSHRAMQDAKGVWHDPIEQGLHVSAMPHHVVCCRDLQDAQLVTTPARRNVRKACKTPHFFLILESESPGEPTMGDLMSRYQIAWAALTAEADGRGEKECCVQADCIDSVDAKGECLVCECDLGVGVDEFGWSNSEGFGGYGDSEVVEGYGDDDGGYDGSDGSDSDTSVASAYMT